MMLRNNYSITFGQGIFMLFEQGHELHHFGEKLSGPCTLLRRKFIENVIVTLINTIK